MESPDLRILKRERGWKFREFRDSYDSTMDFEQQERQNSWAGDLACLVVPARLTEFFDQDVKGLPKKSQLDQVAAGPQPTSISSQHVDHAN